MALITEFVRGQKEPKLQPTKVACTYHVAHIDDDHILLQLDTGGSAERQNPGKQSQTLQLDRVAALALYKILKKEFRFDAS